MSDNNAEPHTETLAETENYLVWKAEEPDGETTFHVELNNVTIHFFRRNGRSSRNWRASLNK